MTMMTSSFSFVGKERIRFFDFDEVIVRSV